MPSISSIAVHSVHGRAERMRRNPQLHAKILSATTVTAQPWTIWTTWTGHGQIWTAAVLQNIKVHRPWCPCPVHAVHIVHRCPLRPWSGGAHAQEPTVTRQNSLSHDSYCTAMDDMDYMDRAWTNMDGSCPSKHKSPPSMVSMPCPCRPYRPSLSTPSMVGRSACAGTHSYTPKFSQPRQLLHSHGRYGLHGQGMDKYGRQLSFKT